MVAFGLKIFELFINRSPSEHTVLQNFSLNGWHSVFQLLIAYSLPWVLFWIPTVSSLITERRLQSYVRLFLSRMRWLLVLLCVVTLTVKVKNLVRMFPLLFPSGIPSVNKQYQSKAYSYQSPLIPSNLMNIQTCETSTAMIRCPHNQLQKLTAPTHPAHTAAEHDKEMTAEVQNSKRNSPGLARRLLVGPRIW